MKECGDMGGGGRCLREGVGRGTDEGVRGHGGGGRQMLKRGSGAGDG